MDEQRKYAILFAATILAARKLSDPELKAWPRAAAITDAIQKAEQILGKARKPYKFTLFSPDGDRAFSTETAHLDSAVKDVCGFIRGLDK
jgi:hypothetical protein